jgi:hypothetical protein
MPAAVLMRLVRCTGLLPVLASLAAPVPLRAQPDKMPTEAELRAAGTPRLTGAEIRRVHLGNTLYHLNLRHGAMFTIYFRDERNRSVKMNDGTRRDTLWWIDGDRRCDESVTRQGIVCSRMYRAGADLRACVDGATACEWLVRVVPGNPEGF